MMFLRSFHVFTGIRSADGRFKKMFQDWEHLIKEKKFDQCIIPAKCKVRVVRKNPMNRVSEYMKSTWSPESVMRVVMCALHADMRMTEGLLAGFFLKAHKLGKATMFNELLQKHCGIKEKFTRRKKGSGYEQHGMRGSECVLLREEDPETGRLKIENVVRELFVQEDTYSDIACELCRTFGEVMRNMRCRFPSTGNLQDLGKHCSHLSLMWSCCLPTSCMMKYYLHTVVHHAGAWQTYLLEQFNMCLGMFENSAFEKSHCIGRLAWSKGCHGISRLDKSELFPAHHAVMRILTRWQHGPDLISLNEARRKAGKQEYWSFRETYNSDLFERECEKVREALEREEREALESEKLLEETAQELHNRFESAQDIQALNGVMVEQAQLLEQVQWGTGTMDGKDLLDQIAAKEACGDEWSCSDRSDLFPSCHVSEDGDDSDESSDDSGGCGD